MENEQGMRQLWMFKTIKQQKKQIVNFKTDLVIENDNGQLKLLRGNQKSNQRFELQALLQSALKTSKNSFYTRIKDTSSNLYLTLDGLLDLTQKSESDENQIFLIKQVDLKTYNEAKDTYVIMNPDSRKCLDIFQARHQVGTPVGIWEINNRGNQRWTLDPLLQDESPQETLYSIKSMLTLRRLWCTPKKELIQTDNDQKVWQLQKKHLKSGELFFTPTKKYLVIEDGEIKLRSKSNGTKWDFV